PVTGVGSSGMQAGCFRYLSTPQGGRAAVRAAMLRSALALVGTAQDWRDAAAHPELFGEG
ncbi:TetR/AcrR family transcriptional regulator, partial [Mycobacteroides abscessus subsp. abscessus]